MKPVMKPIYPSSDEKEKLSTVLANLSSVRHQAYGSIDSSTEALVRNLNAALEIDDSEIRKNFSQLANDLHFMSQRMIDIQKGLASVEAQLSRVIEDMKSES